MDQATLTVRIKTSVQSFDHLKARLRELKFQEELQSKRYDCNEVMSLLLLADQEERSYHKHDPTNPSQKAGPSAVKDDVPALMTKKGGSTSNGGKQCTYCDREGHESSTCRKRKEHMDAERKKQGLSADAKVTIKCSFCSKLHHHADVCRAKREKESPSDKPSDKPPRGKRREGEPKKTTQTTTSETAALGGWRKDPAIAATDADFPTSLAKLDQVAQAQVVQPDSSHSLQLVSRLHNLHLLRSPS